MLEFIAGMIIYSATQLALRRVKSLSSGGFMNLTSQSGRDYMKWNWQARAPNSPRAKNAS
jgi:hypothetical protein